MMSMRKLSPPTMKGSIALLLAYFCLGVCTAIDSIAVNQPLRDSQAIVSLGQTFKLGFFSPANSSNRYVGIMFNIPVVTVIWVANRDKPLNDFSGTMTISEDGNLVVMNGQEEILWSSSVSGSSKANSSAQLLDTGNLVLKDNSNGRIMWESFQNPTDSFLRKMRLGINTSRLTSWRSPSDPFIGIFSVGLESQTIPQFVIWNNGKPYWRSGPWTGNIFIGIPGMHSGYQDRFEIVYDSTGPAYFTYNNLDDSTTNYFTLSSSGSLPEKILLDRKGDWTISWSSFNSQCDVYGKCGLFGSCNPQSSPICTCLQGFEPRNKKEWDGGNWTSGCLRKALLQCERNKSAGQESKLDGYIKLRNMKVPDTPESTTSSEEECGDECLNNCSCIAYAYYPGIGCMLWRGQLVDIQQFSSADGADLYIRVAYSELDKKRNMNVIITTTVIATSLFVALSLYFCWKWQQANPKGKKEEVELPLDEAREEYTRESMSKNNVIEVKLEELPLYSYDTLATATNDFNSTNMIGKGGFGPVYKGKLCDGQEIAVKRLSESSGQGIEEFMNEVVVISKLQHRNLVRLLGCCVDNEEKMLVYEYMQNKSLEAYLFDSSKSDLLDWSKRVAIIEGICRGLLYLHRDSRLKIIHRDLKASNILLDEELNPKISDFGLARIFGGNQDQANTIRVVGTYSGYMAPEYAMEGRFSEKSDVYSFGVLLLEIVSGRKSTSFVNAEDELSLLGYAWKWWNENKIVKFVYPAIFDTCIEMEFLRYVHVGLLCVQEYAKDRPNVSTVLSMLNSEIVELPLPKLPAYAGRIESSVHESSQHDICSVNDVTITAVESR